MWVAELWRFRAKSMAGEDGRAVTARTRPALLGHRAVLGSDDEPLVDGRPWTAPDVARDVVRAAGEEASLVRCDGVERFGVLRLRPRDARIVGRDHRPGLASGLEAVRWPTVRRMLAGWVITCNLPVGAILGALGALLGHGLVGAR